MPNDQHYTVLYQNWDIADRRFWIAWHQDCGNGRTGGLNLNRRCQRQMGTIMILLPQGQTSQVINNRLKTESFGHPTE
ncbi:hypothetical protein BDV38DRAFT_284620 [Aspergillus pseudotamarii]|uniref:Uncharacterized protein n=1 Tax=Aspergillus pseudotamarii TaxID=132259 RepID=A0A5N6SRG4_ASPPS|nr:uncharacterized protein BDV38DRAFT_284620 [Aspergillus pseudotamarii]KAE8135744.1 hypothetical protein BDV38DRAFT_284620 [Aspergillus pseudotamarii]